jgi:hypothetical protein
MLTTKEKEQRIYNPRPRNTVAAAFTCWYQMRTTMEKQMQLGRKMLVMLIFTLGLSSFGSYVFAEFGNVFLTAGGEIYSNVGGPHWVMRNARDHYVYRFEEVTRNNAFIELLCVSRDHNHVRIYRDHVKYLQPIDDGHPDASVWRSFPHSRGYWN